MGARSLMQNVVFVLACAVIAAYWLLMPWARRHDKKVGDRREAAEKPRYVVPRWALVIVAIGMIIGGTVLMHRS